MVFGKCIDGSRIYYYVGFGVFSWICGCSSGEVDVSVGSVFLGDVV